MWNRTEAKREPKGANGEPNAAKKLFKFEPKGFQNETRRLRNYALHNSTEKVRKRDTANMDIDVKRVPEYIPKRCKNSSIKTLEPIENSSFSKV